MTGGQHDKGSSMPEGVYRHQPISKHQLGLKEALTSRASTLSSPRHNPCVYGNLSKGHQSSLAPLLKLLVQWCFNKNLRPCLQPTPMMCYITQASELQRSTLHTWSYNHYTEPSLRWLISCLSLHTTMSRNLSFPDDYSQGLILTAIIAHSSSSLFLHRSANECHLPQWQALGGSYPKAPFPSSQCNTVQYEIPLHSHHIERDAQYKVWRHSLKSIWVTAMH